MYDLQTAKHVEPSLFWAEAPCFCRLQQLSAVVFLLCEGFPGSQHRKQILYRSRRQEGCCQALKYLDARLIDCYLTLSSSPATRARRSVSSSLKQFTCPLVFQGLSATVSTSTNSLVQLGSSVQMQDFLRLPDEHGRVARKPRNGSKQSTGSRKAGHNETPG